jgi:hypothetical protein
MLIETGLNNAKLADDSSIIGGEYISAQLTKPNGRGLDEYKQKASFNRLPFFNITNCLEKVKTASGLTDNDIILLTTNKDKIFNQKNDTQSDSIGIKLYNSNTKQPIDISICNEASYTVNMPVKGSSSINIDNYKNFQRQGIDIYNPKDRAFNTRCYPYISKDTDYDTTLETRIDKIFQNATIECNNGCAYNYINEDSYVECDCTGLNTSEDFVNKLSQLFIESTGSTINLDIGLCYQLLLTVI